MLDLTPLNLVVLYQGWIRPLVFKAIFPLVCNKNTIWWVLGLVSIAQLAIAPLWCCCWKRLEPADLVQSIQNLQQQRVKKELTESFIHTSPPAHTPEALHHTGWIVDCSWSHGLEMHVEILKLFNYSCSSVSETSLLLSTWKRSSAWISSPSHHLKWRPLPQNMVTSSRARS